MIQTAGDAPTQKEAKQLAQAEELKIAGTGGMLSSDSLGDYITKVFAESDDSDSQSAKVGDVEVGQLSAGHYGDDAVAVRATIPVEVSGLSVSIYFDVLYVREGSAVISVTFQSQSTPVDPDDCEVHAPRPAEGRAAKPAEHMNDPADVVMPADEGAATAHGQRSDEFEARPHRRHAAWWDVRELRLPVDDVTRRPVPSRW